MHDCPNCRVPLHEHEEVCPSCGAQQYARKGFVSDRFAPKEKEPSVNFVPIVIVVLVGALVLFLAIQSSWIGQMMNRAPVAEDPMANMTTAQVRQVVEQKITDGLTAAGAKGKLSWTSGGSPVDKNVDQSVELNVDTRLKSKDQMGAIIDPVKDYLSKAKIFTLTMTDSKSGATHTWNVSAPVQPAEEDQGEPPAAAPADQTQQQQPAQQDQSQQQQ